MRIGSLRPPPPAGARFEAGEEEFLPAEKSKSGSSQAIILPGLSRPCGSVSRLKASWAASVCFMPPFFERIAVRIEDHRAHRLVLGDDLLEPLLGGEADQRQAGKPDPAVEADEFQMADHFRGEPVVEALERRERVGSG